MVLMDGLMVIRSSDARWSILPPWLEGSFRSKVSMYDFGDGSYEPYPSIDDLDLILVPLYINENHWVLAGFDLKEKKMSVYDSLRTKTGLGDVKYHLDYMNKSIVEWLIVVEKNLGNGNESIDMDQDDLDEHVDVTKSPLKVTC
ncbi:hypothetical protein L1987_19077 [Smallanthus sonchifolius]|uniref:Uncharacterized protein n=1 Tax=Smallanthus sonchifolius TaxID=185202 RepID=A0ACB9J2I6_9ASTR|nr:hypothetical protein L1987_19077 [Smallanthus sonchifolius]